MRRQTPLVLVGMAVLLLALPVFLLFAPVPFFELPPPEGVVASPALDAPAAQRPGVAAFTVSRAPPA